MALRHEDLSPDELAHQERLERSWVGAQRVLSDSEARSRLEASIERVNSSASSGTMSGDEFLAATESVAE